MLQNFFSFSALFKFQEWIELGKKIPNLSAVSAFKMKPNLPGTFFSTAVQLKLTNEVLQ